MTEYEEKMVQGLDSIASHLKDGLVVMAMIKEAIEAHAHTMGHSQLSLDHIGGVLDALLPKGSEIYVGFNDRAPKPFDTTVDTPRGAV